MSDVLPVEPRHQPRWLRASALIAEARITIEACHRFTYPAGWSTGQRQRGADILLIPEVGSLSVSCGAHRHQAAPGEAVWLPREQPQCIAAAGPAVRFLSLHLSLNDALGLPLCPSFHAAARDETSYACCREAIARFEQEPRSAAAVAAFGIRRLWLDWVPALYPSIAVGAQLSPELRAALWVAQSDPAIGPSGLARAAGCSLVTLRRRFVQQLGVTPAKWLVAQRVQRAAQLLVQSDQSLREIAAASGFSDERYLHLCFKAQYGCTPMSYRAGGP